MFNSSLTSSLSGWFGSSFSDKKEESATEKSNQDNADNVDKKPDQPEGAEVQNVKGEDEKKNDAEVPKSTLDKLTSDEMQAKISEETQKMVTSAMSFGSYLFGVASEASKKMSEKVTETASTIKKTVEEKSIIGDLNREQQDFLQKKRERQFGDASVPPWVGYQESESMKQKILALSTDKRNFLRNPPSGVQFNFDFDHHYPIAMATLKEDQNLEKMRFDLVPKKSDSENVSSTPKQMESMDQLDSPEIDAGVGPEFVSDDFDPSGLNPDDLEREMKQLGMEDETGGLPEWEKELQKELQDYEVVPDGEKDNTWEKEIEDMLSDEAQKQ